MAVICGPLHWARRRPKSTVLLLVLFLFVAANALAFVHAYSMTHFATGSAMTPGPVTLSRTGKAVALFTGVRLARPLNTMTPATLGMPFETRRYRGADGTEYEAWRIPAGGPPWRVKRGVCVMFHGYASCKAGLLREAAVVRRAGYDAFLVDCRGSGGSGGSVTTVGYREADDVAEAEKYVRQNFRPRRLVIYGRSMGAAAALRAASQGKIRPDALIIEAPFDRMLTTVAHRFRAMGVPTFPFARLLVFWGGVQQGYWAFGHNPADYAKSVDCPTLLIRSGKDPFVRAGEAESVFNNLTGPRQMLVFEHAGHEPCIAAERGKWTRTVSAFLRQAPRPAK